MAKRGINQLDDLQIRRLVTKGEAAAKSDGSGLTFTLSKAGTATWVLRYMLAGKPKELTIGNYPDISLGAARKVARERRVEIDNGKDPAALKQSEKVQNLYAWTIKTLAHDFRDKALVVPAFAAQTIYYRKWDLENIIVPRLGAILVSKVTPIEIVQMLKATKRSWTIQKRILTSTKKMFDHAVGCQIIQVNPCLAISLTALMGPRPPVKRRIMLTEDELRHLLVGLEELGLENSLAFRIMLCTCVRTTEMIKAEWEHIDFDKGTWFVPDESVKTRVGFLVPLVPQVMEWLKLLKVLAGSSKWVLPTRRRSKARVGMGDLHVGTTTLWAAIDRALNRGALVMRKFTPHDTRSTAKGHMRNLGISREISEIALNHTLKGMEGIYDVREEIPERRDALEKWAAFVMACSVAVPSHPPEQTTGKPAQSTPPPPPPISAP